MSEITSFVSQLDPTLDRRRILGELHDVSELAEFIVAVEGPEALTVLDNAIPTNKESRQFCLRVIGSVRFQDKGRWYAQMIESVAIVEEFAKELERLVTSEFPPMLDTASITYRQATILGIINNLDEYTQIFSRITTALLNREAAIRGGIDVKPLRGEQMLTQEAETKFLSFMPFLFQHRGKLKQYIQATPTTVVDAEDSDIVSALGRNSWFQTSHFATPWNPLFTFAKWRAEAQAAKYNQRKEQRRAQQLRLLELKGLQEDDGDTAVIQRQIQATSARITKLDARIKDFEEQYLSN